MTNNIYEEKFRPQYHFTPEANWMNDPNGMVYYEGEYHLFYQYHPGGTTWGPMHWGHAISSDMIHWQHLPVALKPDEIGFIFSGSAVVDWNDSTGLFAGGSGLVAIFTHHNTDPVTDAVQQCQSIAYSLDKGRTWIKYAGNPVLEEADIIDFRDPKVIWHEDTKRWVMVLAAGDHARFYSSANLIDWTFTSEFGLQEGSHDGVWECPDLFELPVEGESDQKRWVLIISIGDHPEHPEGSRTQYFVGSFDGSTFTNDHSSDTVLWVDYGRDNYAGVTWSDIPKEDGRRILLGWMSNWKYANFTPTETWRSAMTIPRVLSLKGDRGGIRLIQRPVIELESLREEKLQWENKQLTPAQPMTVKLSGEQLEIRVKINAGDAKQLGLKLKGLNGEQTIIGYDAGAAAVYVDRLSSGNVAFHSAFACRHEAALQLDSEFLFLHLFVDRSSVEVFANDGVVAITDQIFPESRLAELELFAEDGQAQVISLELYALGSIYSREQASAAKEIV